MQHRFWSALAATALVGLTALCAAAAAPLKVAFVYVGPISDGGWSYQHNLGRLALEKPFGAQIETTYVESVPETADAPGKERQGAEALIAQGADVLCQNTDSPAAVQVAEEKGLYAFGWDSDMGRYGQHAPLTANTENWGVYYIDEINKVLDGSWTGNRQAYLGIKDGVVVLTPLNPVVPAEVVRQFDSKKQAIIAGSLLPFAGPNKDNSGALKVAAGSSVSIDDLMAINWYVEAVDGKVPQ